MTDELKKAAQDIVEEAWRQETSSSMVVLSWGLLWQLRDAIERDEDQP